MSDEKRVALISVMVTDTDSVEKLNHILHEFREYIIGRMGLPYPKKDLCLISIAIDAPMNEINSLSGKIGSLKGVSSKAVYSNF